VKFLTPDRPGNILCPCRLTTTTKSQKQLKDFEESEREQNSPQYMSKVSRTRYRPSPKSSTHNAANERDLDLVISKIYLESECPNII
jgi:hypothetical protein